MMNQSNKAKEMSFARRHPAVELVERAVEGAERNVVCLFNDESRIFVVLKLFEEVWRRHRESGKMVLLVDYEGGRWLYCCCKHSTERNLEFSVTYSRYFASCRPGGGDSYVEQGLQVSSPETKEQKPRKKHAKKIKFK